MLLRTGAVCALAVSLFAQGGFEDRFAEIRDGGPARELYGFLAAMPKGGDIHHHFALAVAAETWFEAATDRAVLQGNEFFTRVTFQGCPEGGDAFLRFHNIQRSTFQKLSECRKAEYRPLAGLDAGLKSAWLGSLRIDRPGEGRNEFFEAIVARQGELLRDSNVVLEAAARTIIGYRTQNIRYVETTMGVPNFQDQAGVAVDAAEGIRRIRARLTGPDVAASGVTVRGLFAAIRFQPTAEASLERAYEAAAGNRDLWVGVNLVGREDNDKGHALRFLETLRRMRRKHAGVRLSIHGGEVDSPGREVRDTLALGAERIGHGINLISDPDTMLLMRQGRYLVETSLVSNKLLEYTPDVREHPFIEYLRLGIPVCLNTDDAGAWDSNLSDEYFEAVRAFRLTWGELVRVGRNSLEYSFAQPEVKAGLIASYDREIAAFEKSYGGSDWRERLRGLKVEPTGYARRAHASLQ